MNIAQRIRNAASALFAGTRIGNAVNAFLAKNYYEGAQPCGPRRTIIPAFVRDARFDANSFTRWELSRKIRDFERNVWLIKRLKEIHTKYTVGPHGMPVIPASSDSEWNDRAFEAYAEWCDSPCLDSLLSMGQLHRLMAGEAHIDGEVFILKTRQKGKVSSIPAIQLIESHRVSTPGTEFTSGYNEQEGIVDGCQVDSSGQTIGFWIREGFETNPGWTFRPASQVIHVGMPDRVGMYRYITPYHSSINTLHDLADLEDFEMQRAKANAEDAKIWITPSGELPGLDMLQRRAFSGTAGVSSPADISSNQIQAQLEQFQKILGSRTIAAPAGSEIKWPENPSPSAAQQWFWRLKMSEVSSSVNIPMLLVMPESIQGTVGRAVLDDAQLSFRAWFGVYAIAARAIFRHFMEWAIYNDTRLVDPPSDWAKCHVIPPRACNVDVGRNSAAMLAELAAGTTSYDTIYGANGSTAAVGLRQKARNIGMIKQIAAEESAAMGVEIKPEEIAAPLADIVQKLSAANTEPDDDDETPDKKPRTEEEPVEA